MTERQRARLVQAYLVLAVIMAGGLLHDFLTHTLVNVPSSSRIVAGQSRSAPCRVSAPARLKVAVAHRLGRTSSGGSDQPDIGADATGCRQMPVAERVAHDGVQKGRDGAQDAYRARAPPPAA